MISEIVVCDYGIGNLFNVYRALEYLQINFKVDVDGTKLGDSQVILIPGVAAFGEGISNLKHSKQFQSLQERDKAGTPIVGLCLGAQMLFSSSKEAPGIEGLDLIKGSVETLNSSSGQAPHQGWAEVSYRNDTNSQLSSESLGGYFFFSHGYYMAPKSSSQVVATVEIGGLEVPAVVAHENKLGIQFHPERSGRSGLKFLKFAIDTSSK
jgi:glutamine amidotransferase